MKTPPPWALPLAAGLVAALLLAFVPGYRDHVREREQSRWPGLVRRAMGKKSSGRNPVEDGRPPLGVVAIGTSVLQCAVLYRWEMDALAKAEGKRPLRYREVCVGGHSWDPLPALEAVVDTRPQVLLLESNILFMRNGPGRSGESEGPDFLEYVRFSVESMVSPSPDALFLPGEFQVLPRPSIHPLWEEVTPALVESTRRGRKRQYHPEDLERYLPVLRKARDAGITVVLLDLALDTAVVRWTPEQLRGIADFHSRAAQETGALVWRCPLEFGAHEFYDEGHLSPSGRRRFSRWLAGQFDALPIP